MIREFIMGLTILSGANDMPQLFAPDQHFPSDPMEGTFVVAQTFPDIDRVPPEQTDKNYFFPNQRIKLKYLGEVGSDWPGFYEYRMTLLPPLDPRMCRHPQWHYYCLDKTKGEIESILKTPRKRDMVLSYYRVGQETLDANSYISLEKNGLKVGMYIYGLAFEDRSSPYILFFRDWNTIVSQTYYSEYITTPEGKKEEKIHDVIQILKRVKE